MKMMILVRKNIFFATLGPKEILIEMDYNSVTNG